ncbi:MAG: UDP-3-O-[3-hydroxymyristoyl] N-acetylglucosamine deacetylase, partial [Lentimonas sp.]
MAAPILSGVIAVLSYIFMKQRTILREVSISGKSLHTGEEVHLTLKPAPVNHGIVFQRLDLFGKPELKPLVDFVTDLVRSTTIADGHAKVNTVEHVLSALSGCGVDNVLVEMDASEPPILDGSAKHFVNLIQQAEPVEQDAEREYFILDEPISVTRGASSIIALPHDGFRITCTSTDDRGIHTQHLSLDIDPESYIAQIAPARTFTIYEDIEELLKLGKIKGGSLDSAIVIKGDKILSKEPLRFKEEFVRHKMLDIIGDIVLVGMPIKAHFIAVRPGHALNAELSKVLRQKMLGKIKGAK